MLVKKLSKVFWVVNGIVFCVLVVCAPVIVPIVFGDKYSNTVLIFEILCLNYLLNSQRYLLGNVLAVIKHVKVNLALSILAGLINIVLNLILIWQLASLGAALSSVATTIVAGTLSWIYLFRFFRFNQEESISG